MRFYSDARSGTDRGSEFCFNLYAHYPGSGLVALGVDGYTALAETRDGGGSVQERNEPVGAMVAPWPLHEL